MSEPPKEPKIDEDAETKEREVNRMKRVKQFGDMLLYAFLQKVHLGTPPVATTRYNYTVDRLNNMNTSKMSNPREIEFMKNLYSNFMHNAYGSAIFPDELRPADYGHPKAYGVYIEKGKAIIALAEQAFADANKRMIDEHEAKFEDDDKEESGDVVYGPGGKVVGNGRRRYSVR